MTYHNKFVINGVTYLLETIIIGGSPPNGDVEANVGQLYADASNGFELYKCVSVAESGDTAWTKIIPAITTSDINGIINSIS